MTVRLINKWTATATLLVLCVHSGFSQETQHTGEALRTTASRMTHALSAPDSVRREELVRIFADWVDPAAFTDRAFGDYLVRSLDDYEEVLTRKELAALVAQHRERLQEAVWRRLLDDLIAGLRQNSIRAVHVLAHSLEGDEGHVDLLALAPGVQIEARGQLARQANGWRLVELDVDGTKLSERYRREFSEILEQRYSPPVLISALLERPYVVLEDFSGTPPGELPVDWGAWRDKDQKKRMPYRIALAGEQPYLAAADSGQSVILGKFAHWNPRTHPIMTWCWRANALPPGGDESNSDTNDSAAGLYVIFSQNWLGVPKQLKYVWSTTLPEGTIGRRNMLFRPWFVVVESGYDNQGRWTFEQVDLAAHHELKLGGRPPDRTIGLGILTDANSTDSYAEAGYGELRVWSREALENGLITDYCDCLNNAASKEQRGTREEDKSR